MVSLTLHPSPDAGKVMRALTTSSASSELELGASLGFGSGFGFGFGADADAGAGWRPLVTAAQLRNSRQSCWSDWSVAAFGAHAANSCAAFCMSGSSRRTASCSGTGAAADAPVGTGAAADDAPVGLSLSRRALALGRALWSLLPNGGERTACDEYLSSAFLLEGGSAFSLRSAWRSRTLSTE